jgi:hypothetical protein
MRAQKWQLHVGKRKAGVSMLLCRWTDTNYEPSWVLNKSNCRPAEAYDLWVQEGSNWIGAPVKLTEAQIVEEGDKAQKVWKTDEAQAVVEVMTCWNGLLNGPVAHSLQMDCWAKLQQVIWETLHPVNWMAPPSTTATRVTVGMDLATMCAVWSNEPADTFKSCMKVERGKPCLTWTWTSYREFAQTVEDQALTEPAHFYELTGGEVVKVAMEVSKELPLR